MLVIHYREVSTLLIQEVALAPTNWIGNINIPLEPLCTRAGLYTGKWRETYNVLSAYALGPVHLCDGAPEQYKFSSTPPLHPFLHYSGNQFSQRRGDSNCVWYSCMCFPFMCLSEVCLCNCVSVCVRLYNTSIHMQILPLLWPCEFNSMYYSTLVAIL